MFLTCRFVTRPDVKQKRLGEFLDWTLGTISKCGDLSVSGHQGTVALDGALQSLVNICSDTTCLMSDAQPKAIRQKRLRCADQV